VPLVVQPLGCARRCVRFPPLRCSWSLRLVGLGAGPGAGVGAVGGVGVGSGAGGGVELTL
jgi:hypothetical protein